VLAQLANEYHADTTMQIAQLDASKNDVDDAAVHIHGYPTFYFFTVDRKGTPVEYTGERTLPSIVHFLTRHRSRSLQEKQRQLHEKRQRAKEEAKALLEKKPPPLLE
jgi:hypothetical protein